MMNELTSEILFRCPNCQKLFCTDHVVSQQTEFNCTDCNEDFYLIPERTTSGVYQTLRKSQNEFVNCLKCGHLKNKQSEECPSCGVLESKYQDLSQLESPRLYELNQMWGKIIHDMQNDQVHQDFLNRAQSMFALNFAAQKYIDLKKVMGEDQLIEKYLRQIELRLETALMNSASQPRRVSLLSWPALRKNFLGIEYTYRNIFLLISFIGVLFFIVNVVKPLFPTLNGLIIAAIVLSLGLWSISKNHTKLF